MKNMLLLVRRDLKHFTRSTSGIAMVCTLFLIISVLSGVVEKKMLCVYVVSLSIVASLAVPYILNQDFLDGSLEQILLSGIGPLFVVFSKFISYVLIVLLGLLISIGINYAIFRASISYSEILLLIPITITVCSVTFLTSILTLNSHNGSLLNLLIATPLLMVFLVYSTNIDLNHDVFFTTDIKIIYYLSLISSSVSLCACGYLVSKL